MFPKRHGTLLHHSGLWTLTPSLYGVADRRVSYAIYVLQKILLLEQVFSCVLHDYTPFYRSVHLSVRPSHFTFLGFWLHCSYPNDLVTSITAPAHPHATGAAVYPALFFAHSWLKSCYSMTAASRLILKRLESVASKFYLEVKPGRSQRLLVPGLWGRCGARVVWFEVYMRSMSEKALCFVEHR